MSTRFYAAWALAVILALVLPVAVPFAIWPPREGRQNELNAECGRRAEMDASRETPYSLLPLSSSVAFCQRDDAGGLLYRATVQARGPYGIPYASGSVGPRDIQHLSEHRGVTLGFLALLGGVAAMSAPFVYALLRRPLQQRLAPA
jgi:hypothetical protein